MKMTLIECIWLCIIILALIGFFLAITWDDLHGSTIDFESLRKIVPEGECYGCELPEIKKSVWYCKEFE